MRFKRGDMVRLIDASDMGEGCEWLSYGATGEIVECLGHRICLKQKCATPVYSVRIGTTRFLMAEFILELVPPDDGRKVVSWDWRELLRASRPA